MTSMAQSYPEHFTLTRNGDAWHWINRPMGIDRRSSRSATCRRCRTGRWSTSRASARATSACSISVTAICGWTAGIVTSQADWSLDFDVGMSFKEWHAPVPLAHEIGVFDRALKFLLNLQLGRPVRRLNWTMTINPEARYEPGELSQVGPGSDHGHARERRRQGAPARRAAGLWRLPRSNAIVFSIRGYLLKMRRARHRAEMGPAYAAAC